MILHISLFLTKGDNDVNIKQLLLWFYDSDRIREYKISYIAN